MEAIVERIVRRVVREELAADRAGVAGSNMITMREFGRRHSISENTVRNMIRDGRLAAVRSVPLFASGPTRRSESGTARRSRTR